MITIQFPEPSFRIRKDTGRDYIFDTFRKRWVLLTPEEWVRQNFVQYLVRVMNYPASLVAIEKEIMLGDLKKRFDVLIYDSEHRPWMIIECKAGAVLLGDETLQQALRYNISVPVSYIVITNGSYTYGWQKKEGQLQSISHLPPWKITM